MSGELVGLVVVIVVVVVIALTTAYLTAHRLDRLHIRTDLARAALSGLLQRRHTLGAAIARDLAGSDPDTADTLTHALRDARAHPPDAVTGHDPAPAPPSRRQDARGPAVDGTLPGTESTPDAEAAENRLGVVLAGISPHALDPDLADELVDVTDRLSMARRFYNDAVRDTRALRENTVVRVLRLAGRAPMPDYVELVDTPLSGT